MNTSLDTRAAPRRRRAAPPPRRSASPEPGHVGTVVGLLVGAVVMLVVAAVEALSGTQVPVLSTLAAAPVGSAERSIAAKPPPPATPGSCLNWRRTDAADAEVVNCDRPHLFEQAGAVVLADLEPGSRLPDNQRFRQLVNERCTPLVVNYLGGRYDPNGAFRAGALKPSQKSWNDGDRSLRCGLQRFSRSGALYPISGPVAAQDQADVRPPGTCLGVDGRFIGDPVDCALPHAVESVGAIDLGEKFKSKFPAVGDQDAFLQPACSKLAGDYAGGAKVINEKKLSVLWDNLTQESWAAGTRRVACNLAAQLPDRSGFAPVTGTVKGPVQVSDQAAPPARAAAPPGAPAAGTANKTAEVPASEPVEQPPPAEEPAEVPAAPPAPAPAEQPPPPAVEPPPFQLPEDPLKEKPDLPKPQVPPVAPPGAPAPAAPGG